MKHLNLEAIVLKHSLVKDTDRLYFLLTSERGKISAIAKGVRKITSKRSGSLDTMNHVVVGLVEGNNDFYYINEAKVIRSFVSIKESYPLLRQAQTMLELVQKTMFESDDASRVFHNLLVNLELMSAKKYPEVVVRNKFEIKHLELLGYKIPDAILDYWKRHCKQKKLLQADMLIRGYIRDILDIDLKSLEF